MGLCIHSATSCGDTILVRTLLLFLANREDIKNFALKFRVFRNTALRFVAGETLDDAIRAVRYANQRNIHSSLDFLGENTRFREDAQKASQEAIGMLDKIQAEQVDCYVSVKLTQLGLDLDTEFCYRNLTEIVKHARNLANFVRVDMENSYYTQQTLDIVLRVHEKLDNLGTVIQAYLYRSEQDVLTLLKSRIPIRLCKGAYLEPDNLAFRRKRDTNANFVKLMKILLKSDIYHAIATHDEAMISATKEYAQAEGISKKHFEFQMLYGVRRDLQQQLAQEGYNVRVYIPYGRRWYPYFMRRLAERPANVAFIVRNFFKD